MQAGQTYTVRLSLPCKGNSVIIDRGAIEADFTERIYLTGAFAWELPLTTDYMPGKYTGGAFVLILSPNMATREMCVRLNLGEGYAITVQNSKCWVAAGSTGGVDKFYLANPIQSVNTSTSTKRLDAWFAVIDSLKCHNSYILGKNY